MSKLPARLIETGRKCDGCGVTIGRWTEKCYLDEKFNRVYCSVNGCAETVKEAGECAGCGTPLNPFEEEIITNPLDRMVVRCADCGVVKPGAKVKKVEGISIDVLDLVNAGPYVVEEGLTIVAKEPIFKIRYGADGPVRSTFFDKVSAYKKCAEFNKVEI